MAEPAALSAFLEEAEVEKAVLALRPDYRALLLAVDGIEADPRDETVSKVLMQRAEARAAELLAEEPVEHLPHVAAWREAYRAFGAKPQRTRNSLEALTRRSAAGLPRVNPLTDTYNAISVLHQVPLGGEDLARYVGSPRLVRAVGTEVFDTMANGEHVVEHPDPGEVVWRDEEGVTCRRWNWRQGVRTQLSDDSTSAVFILDALAPLSDQALSDAAEDLITHLRQLGPDVRVARRLVTGSTA